MTWRERVPAPARAAARRLRGRSPAPVADAPWYPEGVSTQPPADLLTMGHRSYHAPKVVWHVGDTGRVRVGNWCSVHHTVQVFAGGEHRVDWATTFALREILRLPGAFASGLPHGRGDVVIGHDVYIGVEAVVLSGVTIGDGAVVGARSVVTRDVPPYAVVTGSPAAQVRWRFGEAERAAFARVRWWDWPEERVVANVDALSSPDVGAFLAAHDEEYRASVSPP